MAARSLAALALLVGIALAVRAGPDPPPVGDPKTSFTVGNATSQAEKGKTTYTVTVTGTCNLLKKDVSSFTGCSATLTPKGFTTDPDLVALVTYPDGQPTPDGGPKSVLFTWTGVKKGTYQGNAVMGWLDKAGVQNSQSGSIPKFDIK
ncbi:MAG: hypothetical protein K2V38_19230 [Gemmataceae bacterium]|nr:hypothetical protein [Gemmataceae bacterium]